MKTILAIITVAIGLLTVAWPDWLEALFETSPDASSGALEAVIATVMLLVSVLFALSARRDFRQRRVALSDRS